MHRSHPPFSIIKTIQTSCFFSQNIEHHEVESIDKEIKKSKATRNKRSKTCKTCFLSFLQVDSCTLKEYWIIYRGPGFHLILAVLWLGSSHTPSPVSKLAATDRKTGKERHPVDGRGKVGGLGAKWDNGEKDSINHSILSVYFWDCPCPGPQ
jgi:hypothetical protein